MGSFDRPGGVVLPPPIPFTPLPELDVSLPAQSILGRAVKEDGVGAVVLGCAGMADLAADLAAEHGVPVIDGVAAAVGLARMLNGLGPAIRPTARST